MASETPTTPPPAWDSERLSRDPHKDSEKAERVQAMFSAIAHAYDLNNRVHSMGLDQAWRRRAVAESGPVEGADVLDAACGTGDLAAHYARAGARSVVGLDYTKAMLEVARTKALREGGAVGAIRFVEGDALRLPYSDAAFDIVSIAFGIRNVTDPVMAISQFRRVLRPSGRLAILEFSRPRSVLVRAAHGLYTRRIMPWTASWLAADRSGAYRYLPRSVETFLDAAQLADSLRECGFATVAQHRLAFGTCTLTIGRIASA